MLCAGAMLLVACTSDTKDDALGQSPPTTTPTTIATASPSASPIATPTSVQASYSLNDTGQDWCADGAANNLGCPVAGYENQDGDHGGDAQARAGTITKSQFGGGNAGFDFTKLDANGNELDPVANGHSCVRDNVTGLVWEVKTTDGGLQDASNTYTWYNTDSTINMGRAGKQNGGTCTGSNCDTHAYTQAVNELNQPLCGYSDWRMPTREELRSIVDYGSIDPAIDTNFFPSSKSSKYWSESANAGNSIYVWFLHFGGGYGSVTFRGDVNYVRLVRGM